MSQPIATWIQTILAIYLLCGVVFAVPFVVRGVGQVDPSAREASWGFRLLIWPGCVALWPLLLTRWMSGAQAPAEKNPHRERAGAS